MDVSCDLTGWWRNMTTRRITNKHIPIMLNSSFITLSGVILNVQPIPILCKPSLYCSIIRNTDVKHVSESLK